jgi:hypothetical protein
MIDSALLLEASARAVVLWEENKGAAWAESAGSFQVVLGSE